MTFQLRLLPTKERLLITARILASTKNSGDSRAVKAPPLQEREKSIIYQCFSL